MNLLSALFRLYRAKGQNNFYCTADSESALDFCFRGQNSPKISRNAPLYGLPQTKKIISNTFRIRGTLVFLYSYIYEREREGGREREREPERKSEREREKECARAKSESESYSKS
jgi:hypothetical protein